ncbi:uncharacterized protein [Dermacentor andersoni]|uniref:uncharacterized protein n=1 Tax=Dermacentor andersoni TaxID=34620 RepID=UPI002418030C|nr:uncharacterized protein LOC126528062 [Dermacentor andersoni]
MGKAKKSKSGGKAKKGKPGAKGKKGSKGSSSATKAASAKPSEEPSPSQQTGKGSEQTSTSQSATPSQTETSATSFKPLNRPPLEPLVLPADLDLSLPRRPSTIYVWDCGNVWFFPVGVVALAVVVLGMILMSYNIQSEYAQTPNDTTAAAHNATSVAVAESTETNAVQVTRRWFNATRRKHWGMSREPTDAESTASDAVQVTRRWFNATRRKHSGMSREPTDAESTASDAVQVTRRWFNATRRKHSGMSLEPTDAVSTASDAVQVTRRWFNATRRKHWGMSREPTDEASTASNDEWTAASAGAESTTSAEGVGDGSATLAVQVAGEKDNANVIASSEASTPARAWLHAPVDSSQGAIHATNSLPVASKEAHSEERPQKASAALGNDP